ncbi:putative motility protein [Hydrogenobaculum acidophilum]
MSYMDIANIATDMQQASNVNKQQIWGLKSMLDNQSNVVQQLLGEVSNTNNSNNPPYTGEKLNVKA